MRKFLIKLCIGILVFGFFVWRIGFKEITHNLANINPVTIILVLSTTLTSVLLQGSCVILLGKTQNSQLTWRTGIKGFLATISLSIFVPGRAGDFALPFYWKEFLTYGESLSVVLIDKLNNLCWVLILASCGLYFIFKGHIGFIAAGTGFFSIFFTIFLITIPKSRKTLSNILPQKGTNFIKGSMNALRSMIQDNKSILITTFFFAGIKTLIGAIGFSILLWGLNISSPLYYTVCLISIAQLVALLPITVLGLGTMEAICIYGMKKIGIEPESVIAALFAGRIITIFWLSIFFTIFNLNKNLPVNIAKTKK